MLSVIRGLNPSVRVPWQNIRGMKTKSRFLRAPVEPFVVQPDAAADDLLARMERISFQGRNLATARRIWEKMLGDDCTIFLGMAGALSAGGLRMIVAHLIAHRYIDCLVSTGANLYHDLHETRGRHHYLGSPHEDDAALQAEHIDRVYDTYAQRGRVLRQRRVDCRVRADARAAPLHLARVPLQARRVPLEGNRPGRHPDRRLPANVPIFCPAIADSSIGMGLSQARHRDADGRPDRRHRRHHRVGQRRDPPSAHRVGRARRRHAEELHQPGERAGGVLRRPHRRPPLRAPDRHRRAAFRRRLRLEPRRGAQLGQAGDRRRAGHRPRRRDDRAAAARQRAGRQRARHARRAASRCAFDLSGPTMAVNGRPFPPARFEAR